jgi:hypothetical protein
MRSAQVFGFPKDTAKTQDHLLRVKQYIIVVAIFDIFLLRSLNFFNKFSKDNVKNCFFSF